MTIASEISRLQTDKEAMRQAIIWKWVDVAASVSFDDYAACINAIEQWGVYKNWTPVSPDQCWTMSGQQHVTFFGWENTSNKAACVRGYSCVCTSGSDRALVFCISNTPSYYEWSGTCATRAAWTSFAPYYSCWVCIAPWECAYLHLQWWHSPASYKYQCTRVEVCTIS